MPDLDPRAERLAALLSDRYEFLSFLGQGGFAAVYKVRGRSLDRLEALKVLLATHEDDPDFAERFQQEARVAASLDHPNIVRIHEFGRAEELYWYSMQFVDGPTLTRALASGGPMDERRAAALMAPLCDALAYAHGRGIVHRDVKPDNVILGPTGRPHLMDFGIAKSENSLVKTQSGLILGSPAFLSPEQVRGEPPDGRSDIYSLGITLYQMVSGQRPFTADDRALLMVMRLRDDPVPLSEARPGVAPELALLVMRCLARDKAGRPTAEELRDALLDFLDGTGGRPLAARLSGEVTVPPRAVSDPPPDSDTAPTRRQAAPTLPTARESVPTVAFPRPQHPSAPPAVPPPVPQPVPTPTASAPARRSRAPLLGGLGLLVLGSAVFLGRTLLVKPGPAPVAGPRATAVPAALPTAAPAPAPAPTATAPPAPTATPVPEPPRATARPPRPAREAPAEPLPVPARRAVVPAEILEQVPVTLPPDVAAEYAGKSVALKVTVREDGSLKSATVYIPVQPPCAACDAAALEAVKRFRFAPAKDRDGRPVESSFGVAVRF